MNSSINLLLIDNYDSFTYNLYQMLLDFDVNVTVVLNDKVTNSDLENIHGLIISPGPGKPENAGLCNHAISKLVGKVPILGICLGHQCITTFYYGKVGKAQNIMHGKQSEIYHDGKLLFKGIQTPLTVGRYHSLIAFEDALPDVLEISAYSREAEIMAIRHKLLDIYGLQFHPESILTPDGRKIIKNYIAIVRNNF